MNTIVFLLTVIPVIALSIFSIKKHPEWLSEGKLLPHWNKINIVSMLTGIVLSALSFFVLYSDAVLFYKAIASLSTGLITFILGQTIFTDGFQRLADRRILRSANLLSLVVGLAFLSIYETRFIILIYILFILFSSIVLFLPGIGMSDGRAIQLIVLSTFPVIGIQGFQIGIIAFVPVILLYGIIVSIKRKSFKGFFTKISVPMVPLMLAPFLSVVLIQPIL